MKLRDPIPKSIFILSALLWGLPPARAQETLNYTSGPITSIEISGPPQFAPQAMGLDITGVITLAQALPANGVTTISDGSGMFGIGGNNQYAIEGSFTFVTANNAVVAFRDDGASPGDSDAFASLSGDSASTASFGYGTPYGGYTADAAPGGWVDPPALAAPEVSPYSAPTAITFLLGVMAMVRGRRLWHKQQSSI